MKLSRLLCLQVVYCLLGIGYNVASYLAVSSGKPPFSATLPIVGGAVMTLYGLFLIPGFFRAHKTYRVLMGLSIIVLGYGGIVKHLLNLAQDGLAKYSSATAFSLAVGINVFGLVLNIMAVSGKYKKEGAKEPRDQGVE
jgi:hypothetical protein